jgi:hypothetical protein
MEIHAQKVQGMSKQMQIHKGTTKTIKTVVMKWKIKADFIPFP